MSNLMLYLGEVLVLWGWSWMQAESIEDTDSDAGSEGNVNSDEISTEESISDASTH